MNEQPILFKGPLVRAILAGTKTVTRRIVKPQPEPIPADVPHAPGDDGFWWPSSLAKSMVQTRDMPAFCPYGTRGDRLWVKETWSKSALTVYPCPAAWYRADFDRYEDPTTKEGQKYHGTDCERGKRPHGDCWACVAEREGPFRWRPSIFMPRSLSRITLEVTSVRVERLQDITDADILAEGAVERWHEEPAPVGRTPVSSLDGKAYLDVRSLFAGGWDAINAKRAPWASNPWVWCVSFRRLP